MVAFLILVYVFIAIVVIGIVFTFASELVAFFSPLYTNSPLAAYTTPEMDWGWGAVQFMFWYVLIPALIGLMYYTYSMGQKPERPWR